MQARARKSALLAAAAVLIDEVREELTEDGASGESEVLAGLIGTLTDLAEEWEEIEA